MFQIARWGDRVRQVIGGFIDGFSAQLQASAKGLRHYAEAFGITSTGMVTNRESARQLGEQLAKLLGYYLQLRVAMFGLAAATTVVNGAMTFGKAIGAVGRSFLWAGGMLLRFVRWLPIAAAWIGRVASFLRALGTLAARVFSAVGCGALATTLALIAAQVTGVVLIWRHWNALQRNTAPMIALRMLAQALFLPFYGLIHIIKTGPQELAKFRVVLARVGAWFSATFARVGPIIGGAFRSAGAWVWRGLTTIFAPIGRALRLIGSFVVIALYLPLAYLWAKVGPTLTRFVHAAGALLSRAGHAVGAFFVGIGHDIASLVGRFGSWVGGLAARAWGAVTQLARGVGQRIMGVVTSVRGVFTRLGGAIGTFFRGLGGQTLVFFAPMLARVASFAAVLRSLLGGAFTWVASTAASAFGGLADLILSPLRFIARQLVMLFRGLPRNLQPAGLAGMVATLEGFGGGGGPAGGAPPTHELRNQHQRLARKRLKTKGGALLEETYARTEMLLRGSAGIPVSLQRPSTPARAVATGASHEHHRPGFQWNALVSASLVAQLVGPTPEASPPSPAPVPTPSASGAPAPGATPVPVSVRQQATAQSQGATRGPTVPPVVQVNVPPSPPAQVRLIVDGRELTTRVESRQETEKIRGGRG